MTWTFGQIFCILAHYISFLALILCFIVPFEFLLLPSIISQAAGVFKYFGPLTWAKQWKGKVIVGTRTAVCSQTWALFSSVCFFCRVISSHLAPGSRTDVQGGPQPQCQPARAFRWSPTRQPAPGNSHRPMPRYNTHSQQVSGCNLNLIFKVSLKSKKIFFLNVYIYLYIYAIQNNSPSILQWLLW